MGAWGDQGGTPGCCPLPTTWAEVVDDSAVLLTEGSWGPVRARGLAEGLWFRGHPLCGGCRWALWAQQGSSTRVRGGNGRSAPSPMCSMVSLMTSHSMGQRGAGRGPRAEGRAKRARGSPGDPRCRAEGSGVPQRRAEGAGSSSPGAARGPGGAAGALVRCRLHDTAPAEIRGAQAGRVGMPPKTTPHCTPSMAEHSSRPWGSTDPSAGGLRGGCGGLTHGSAPAWDPTGSWGQCCLYQLPRWGAAPRGPPETWGSSACPPSGLGESTAAAQVAGGA